MWAALPVFEMPNEPRRSGRARQSSSKANNIFLDDEIFGPPEPEDRLGQDGDDSADEFDARQEAPSGQDDEMSDDGVMTGDEQASVQSDQEDANVSKVPSKKVRRKQSEKPKKTSFRNSKRLNSGKPSHSARRPLPSDSALQSRGVPFNLYPYIGRDKSFVWLVGGGDTAENQRFLEMMDKFYNELAFPSRNIGKTSDHGMGNCSLQSEQSRDEDRVEAWEWYDQDAVRSSFARLQNCQPLSDADTETYFPPRKTSDLVAGQLLQLRHISLPPDNSISADELFEGTPLTDELRTAPPRRGWLINLGTSLTASGWAPNRAGPAQYLAVSPTTDASGKVQTTSAFAPAQPTPASIHILSFLGIRDGGSEDAYTIDARHNPHRVLSINFDYGRVLQLKWCPIPRNPRTDLSPDRTYLGLLAFVSADGVLRVLDVTCASATDGTTENVLLTRCAFETKPPGTICTCFTWMSSTLIAAGCANGYVAIWDLDGHLAMPTPPANAVPEFYHHCNNTYITGLATCYPSLPHILASSSMDGCLRLVDIRDPIADTALALRGRTPLVGLEWMDGCLSVLGVDDSFLLKGANVRHIAHFTGVMKSSATATALAVSPVHACVLVGCADGTIGGTNAMRRLYKERSDSFYKQLWVQHEWRPGQPVQTPLNPALIGIRNEDSPQREQSPQLDFPNGLSRLVTGFRLEDTRAEGGLFPRTEPKGAEERQLVTTIYERETAITNITWNPNLEAGGWAAAATSSGLLLVEDLCYD